MISSNDTPAFASRFAFMLLLFSAPHLLAQRVPVQVPAATPLLVELNKSAPMKMGEPLESHLLYPVYAENKLVIPAGSIVRGNVVFLKPNRKRRVHAKLWGDFTPYDDPAVKFDQLIFPDGTVKHIASDETTDGALILHLSAPNASKPHSLISREIAALKNQAKRSISVVTAPGRKERMVRFVYRQLPYHPQRIEAGTTWTVTLAQPLTLQPYDSARSGEGSAPEHSQARQRRHQPSPSTSDAAPRNGEQVWHLHAYLEQTISSATEKRGNTFEAIVAAPVFNPNHTLAVPEGSVLVGTITRAKPARFFGRAGELRFDFRELKLPGNSSSKPVEGSLGGMDARKQQQLQIDSEGGVESKPQDRVIVPLVLTLLAGRAFDDDGNVAGNAALASNGFGILGRIVGVVAGSRDLAAGIGFYAAGLSFAERWLVHGPNIVFEKNTRIEVTTVASRKPLPVTGS